MGLAMATSLLAIYLALVVQFNSLTKPMLVFAAVPFQMAGGLMGLLLFDVPLGFMALLGLASLAGVIISHVIVLFEYIEEAHERGEPLRRAVIDAALVRLRPVLVTVLATVGGLIPLARRGGPLREPLCYVQIVELLTATLVTLGIVPILYVLFVEDLRLVRWAPPGEHTPEGPPSESTEHAVTMHGITAPDPRATLGKSPWHRMHGPACRSRVSSGSGPQAVAAGPQPIQTARVLDRRAANSSSRASANALGRSTWCMIANPVSWAMTMTARTAASSPPICSARCRSTLRLRSRRNNSTAPGCAAEWSRSSNGVGP